jgi:Xaa-Pro aminopeptidase
MPAMGTAVSVAEFEERRTTAGQLAADAGLDGLIVCSRGGGTLDRFADVFWLTGFYTQFPYIPDVAGNWSGRAHAVACVKPSGSTRLVVDVPSWVNVALPDECITFADFVTDATIKAIEDGFGRTARLGLVGADTMPASMYRAIASALPGIELVDVQADFNALKAVKSPAEIELLRNASLLGSRAIDAMMQAARAGMNHGEALSAAMNVLLPARAILYNAFIRSGSGGPDPHFVRSALPTWGASQTLQDGEFLCAGLSGVLDGYYFDLARCRPVGRVSNAMIDVFESTIAVVEAGISAAQPGATGEQVMQAGSSKQAELGFPKSGNFQGFGHGIGLGWDDPWLAPGITMKLAPGMVICVEKWLMRDGYAGDYEDTILITADGNEKITDAQMRWW